MPKSEFANLAERLLAAGVAPRHVARLISELESHYRSLLEEEITHHPSLEAATARARSRLGSNDALCAKVLADPALRSWGTRWPLSTCGLMPLVGLVASSVGLIILLILMFELGKHLYPEAARAGHFSRWLHHVTDSIRWFALYGLPPLWAAILTGYAVSRRMKPKAPLIGLMVIATFGAVTTMSVVWPSAGVAGRLSAGLGFSVSSDAMTMFGMRWGVTMAVACAIYYWMNRRLHKAVRT